MTKFGLRPDLGGLKFSFDIRKCDDLFRLRPDIWLIFYFCSYGNSKIVPIKKSPDIDDFSIMEVLPSKTNAVPGFTDLSSASPGNTLLIHIANHMQKEHGLKAGSHISAMIRKAPRNLFVIPDSVKVL